MNKLPVEPRQPERTIRKLRLMLQTKNSGMAGKPGNNSSGLERNAADPSFCKPSGPAMKLINNKKNGEARYKIAFPILNTP
jgi:hypothetical protein